MKWQYFITGLIFLYFLYNNYIGAVGRIEGVNQYNNKPQNLGPVSKKEQVALFEGKHKVLAFKQALIGAAIYSLIILVILLLIF